MPRSTPDTAIENIEEVSGSLLRVEAPTTDRLVIRLVVAFLGALAIIGVVFGGLLSLYERAVPDFLIASTSAAIGALGALLAKTSSAG